MSEEQNEMFFSCEIADLCIKLQDVKKQSVFPIQDFFFLFPNTIFFKIVFTSRVLCHLTCGQRHPYVAGSIWSDVWCGCVANPASELHL